MLRSIFILIQAGISALCSIAATYITVFLLVVAYLVSPTVAHARAYENELYGFTR